MGERDPVEDPRQRQLPRRHRTQTIQRRRPPAIISPAIPTGIASASSVW